MPSVEQRVIQLHRAQRDFRHSPAMFRGFVGGRGSGKSFAGSYDLCRRACPSIATHGRRPRLYMVAAPTYPLLRDSALRTFLDVARRLTCLREFRRGDMTAVLTSGAEVIFRSADDPDKTMRGPNLSGAWLDEASQMERPAFDLTIAALREGGEQGWLSATFTPRGKQHWTFETFGRQTPNTALFHANTAQNPFNPPAFADVLRQQYTSAFAEQEIDGRFIDAGGILAKREWFRVLPAAPVCVRKCRAWDFAATAKTTADWTVGALMGLMRDGGWCLLHVVRGQVAGGSVEALVRQTAQQDGRDVEIAMEQEPGSGGKIAVGYITRALAGYNIHAWPSTGDKVTRAMPMLAQAEAGNVCLAPGAWGPTWLDEIASFPEGAHDDQVDAACLAFNRLTAPASGFL